VAAFWFSLPNQACSNGDQAGQGLSRSIKKGSGQTYQAVADFGHLCGGQCLDSGRIAPDNIPP